MECKHIVHSIKHKISGKIYLNDEEFDFTNSYCYIEGDRGISFPKVYIWTHAFTSDGSLMLSVADIPFGLSHFTGLIGFVNYKDSTKILGTYNFAKPIKISNNEIIVKQGKYKLTARLIQKSAFPLKSPTNGSMERIIKESASCTAYYKFETNKGIIFEKEINNASFEYEYNKNFEFDRS